MRRPVLRSAGMFASAAVVVLGVVACSPAPSATPGLVETSSLGVPASGAPAGSPVTEPVSTAAEPAWSGPPAASPSEGAVETPPTSPVVGVLTDIDTAGLDQVAGFRLRLDDGQEVVFVLGDLENPVDFPPGHLGEHIATSSPIRVFFRPDGTDLVVYRMEDAQ